MDLRRSFADSRRRFHPGAQVEPEKRACVMGHVATGALENHAAACVRLCSGVASAMRTFESSR